LPTDRLVASVSGGMQEASTSLEPRSGSELATTALRFARRVHLGQHRKQTNEQFVQHPIAVATLLLDSRYDRHIIPPPHPPTAFTRGAPGRSSPPPTSTTSSRRPTSSWTRSASGSVPRSPAWSTASARIRT